MMEWVLTYAVHSTVLIAVVWLSTSVVARLSLGTREVLWKVALLGPLVTATVVTATGVPSLWGALPVPAVLRTEPVASLPPAAAGAGDAGAGAATAEAAAVEHRIVRHRAGELQITAVRHRAAAPGPAGAVVAAPAPVEPTTVWPLVLLGLWGLGAAAALGRLGWAASRLRTQLKGRRDVVEDPVLESFLELCSKAGLRKRPRLTASAHLRSPIALGRREICLPERAVDSLSPPQQQGMLAHEMAHLVRFDPLWSVAVAVVEAVFFFQPLNHLARRKIQEVAEYQCDDWAARQTGTGVHLAKCLAEVARWVEDGPPMSSPVVAMADRGSPIVRRITRLLHQRRTGGRVHPVGRVAMVMGTLAAVIAVVPGLSQAEAPSPVLALAPADASAPVVASAGLVGGVVFEDRSDGGHDRSHLRVQAGGEVVEIEVEARRPAPAPPPPAPPLPPEPRSELVIIGSLGASPWGGWWGGWLGDDLFGFGGIELMLGPVHHHHDHDRGWRERARAERDWARAERDWARAERDRERARVRLEREVEREVEREIERELGRGPWPSIFGVSLGEAELADDERSAVFEL